MREIGVPELCKQSSDQLTADKISLKFETTV